MLTFYLCFLAGGVVLPLFNAIMSFISGNVDSDADMDLDTEVGGDIQSASDLGADADAGTDLDVGPDADAGADVEVGADVGGEGESLLAISLLPTSLLSLSALAIIFGAIGALMTMGNRNKILTFVLAAVFGYLASVIIQSIIKTLKKIQTRSSGINENELLLYDGRIVDTILPGQMGTVSFMTLKNVLVSYPAKCEDSNLKLEVGRIVRVKEYSNGVFIVEPKNKYEI